MTHRRRTAVVAVSALLLLVAALAASVAWADLAPVPGYGACVVRWRAVVPGMLVAELHQNDAVHTLGGGQTDPRGPFPLAAQCVRTAGGLLMEPRAMAKTGLARRAATLRLWWLSAIAPSLYRRLLGDRYFDYTEFRLTYNGFGERVSAIVEQECWLPPGSGDDMGPLARPVCRVVRRLP
jgi:hypothetical protein